LFEKPAGFFSAPIDIPSFLKDLGLVETTSEARRLIEGKAIEVNSVKVNDIKMQLNVKVGAEFIVKVGKKKFGKVKVTGG
jgi:tyrosyl-tRNA synthetase